MAEQKKAQEQDLNHLLQVRREKLADRILSRSQNMM